MHTKYEFVEVVEESGKPVAKVNRLIKGFLFGFRKWDTMTFEEELCRDVLEDARRERGTNVMGAEYADHNEGEMIKALNAIEQWKKRRGIG